MDDEYWLDRWEREDIGFHQNETNHYLTQYWPALNLTQKSEIFVPLCGKSRDMLWLREQGHMVLGVELSTFAALSFFGENNLQADFQKNGKLDCLTGDGIRILCGNFFDVSPSNLTNISAVYDRAALVALSPEMRRKYASYLLDILPSGTKILVIGFDYPQSEMIGPPFAVSPDEVEMLYGQHATIRQLAQIDVLDQNERFRECGLSRLYESVYLITKNTK